MPFEAPLLGHRLFWAALPDAETAGRVAEIAERERPLRGSPLQKDRLHVTLYHVGDAVEPPPAGLIDALTQRATSVVMPRFKVSFDVTRSLGSAFVLSGEDGVVGLDVLHQRLSDAIDWKPRRARPFLPHMTLLYDRERIGEQPIEAVTWTVREMVLIESLVGQTVHRHLARLPLH